MGVKAKKGKQGKTIPAIPVIPLQADSRALESWRYRDPAEVVERSEQSQVRAEARAQARLAEEAAQREVRAFGRHLSADTIRLIKRERIRALVAEVLGRKVTA